MEYDGCLRRCDEGGSMRKEIKDKGGGVRERGGRRRDEGGELWCADER